MDMRAHNLGLKIILIAYLCGSLLFPDVLQVNSAPILNDKEWVVDWGRELDDYAYDIAASDNNVYISGRTKSFGAGGYDVFLLKHDLEGNLLWNTTWGGPGDEGAWAITTYDDRVYITGYRIAPGVNFNAFLLNYDSDGNLLWNATYDSDDHDVGRDIEASESGVFLTGESGENAFLIKYNHEGQLQWIETWTIPDGRMYGYCLQIENNQIFVAGYYFNFSAGRDPNIFLTKFDMEGQQIWNTTWNAEGGPIPTEMTIEDAEIYLTGIIEGTTGEREWDALLAKFNESGDFQWSQRWGGPKHERARNLIIYDDTVYVIGFTRSYGAGGADVFLLEYDSEGHLQLNSTWGETGNETYPSFTIADGSFYISGMTDSFGAEGYFTLNDGSTRLTYNVFLMKVNISPAETSPVEAEEPMDTTGIPGFPHISIIIGLVFSIIIIWFARDLLDKFRK